MANLFETCGYPLPVSLAQLLASILVKDDDGNVLGFRTTISVPDVECDCNSFMDCDNNSAKPEDLAMLGFGLDECGKLALRLVVCDGTLTT